MKIPLQERFWKKVAIGDPRECWFWKAAIKYDGYGMFNFNGINTGAHRVAYYLSTGVFDGSLTLDHLCRNRNCVNPTHLELVSRGENVRRGNSKFNSAKVHGIKTNCPYGHPYDDVNTYKYYRDNKACRGCKECRRENVRKNRRKIKENENQRKT